VLDEAGSRNGFVAIAGRSAASPAVLHARVAAHGAAGELARLKWRRSDRLHIGRIDGQTDGLREDGNFIFVKHQGLAEQALVDPASDNGS